MRRLIRRAISWLFLAAGVTVLVAGTAIRINSYVIARKAAKVVAGLTTLEIDKTTEEELLRKVPYLLRGQYEVKVHPTVEYGDVDSGVQRGYYASFSNDLIWLRVREYAGRFSNLEYTVRGPVRGWMLDVASLLGIRFIRFSAGVVILNGKVSAVRYEVGNNLVHPEEIGDIISVNSAHGFWAPHRMGLRVPSTTEENPSVQIEGDDIALGASFTLDAPPDLRGDLFKVSFNCFWGLRGCTHPRQIAPAMWRDKQNLSAATLARLKSTTPCPDSLVVGRIRDYPDINVVLLESTGFETKNVIEDGEEVGEIWTHYKLVEVLRRRNDRDWSSVRGRNMIADPTDSSRKLPNQGLQWIERGTQVLAFSNLHFESCRMVVATPSAVAAVKDTRPAARRAEDLTGVSIM